MATVNHKRVVSLPLKTKKSYCKKKLTQIPELALEDQSTWMVGQRKQKRDFNIKNSDLVDEDDESELLD